MTYVKWGIVLLIATVLGGFLHYSLPSRDIVRIVDTDVKRMDFVQETPQGGTRRMTRDISFIYAIEPNGNERVYRNEDTNWGWPPYLKFDTANLQARASNLRSEEGSERWVVVRHYGWRVPILSMFPNALSIREAAGPDETLYPWFNGVILAFLLATVLMIRRAFVYLFERHVEPVLDRVDQEYDEAAEAVNARYRGLTGWFRKVTGR